MLWTKTFAKAIIIVVWTVAIGVSLPTLFMFHVVVSTEKTTFWEGMKLRCNMKSWPIYITSLIVIQYLIPFTVITVAYAVICWKMWGTQTPGQVTTSARDQQVLEGKKKVM